MRVTQDPGRGAYLHHEISALGVSGCPSRLSQKKDEAASPTFLEMNLNLQREHAGLEGEESREGLVCKTSRKGKGQERKQKEQSPGSQAVVSAF